MQLNINHVKIDKMVITVEGLKMKVCAMEESIRENKIKLIALTNSGDRHMKHFIEIQEKIFEKLIAVNKTQNTTHTFDC